MGCQVKAEEDFRKFDESDKDTSDKYGDTENDISADEVTTFPNKTDLIDVCDKSDESDKKDISDKHGDAENDTSAIITLPDNVDFADAATMRRLVEENEEEEELEEEKRAKDNSNVENPVDISTEIVEENEEEKEEVEEEKRATNVAEENEEEKEEVEEKRAEDNSNVENSVDISTEMIVNMFLRSPHGYDFYDSGAKMS